MADKKKRLMLLRRIKKNQAITERINKEANNHSPVSMRTGSLNSDLRSSINTSVRTKSSKRKRSNRKKSPKCSLEATAKLLKTPMEKISKQKSCLYVRNKTPIQVSELTMAGSR